MLTPKYRYIYLFTNVQIVWRAMVWMYGELLVCCLVCWGFPYVMPAIATNNKFSKQIIVTFIAALQHYSTVQLQHTPAGAYTPNMQTHNRLYSHCCTLVCLLASGIVNGSSFVAFRFVAFPYDGFVLIRWAVSVSCWRVIVVVVTQFQPEHQWNGIYKCSSGSISNQQQ